MSMVFGAACFLDSCRGVFASAATFRMTWPRAAASFNAVRSVAERSVGYVVRALLPRARAAIARRVRS